MLSSEKMESKQTKNKAQRSREITTKDMEDTNRRVIMRQTGVKRQTMQGIEWKRARNEEFGTHLYASMSSSKTGCTRCLSSSSRRSMYTYAQNRVTQLQ